MIAEALKQQSDVSLPTRHTTVILELVLGDCIASAIITSLLIFNAVLGYFQEGKAQTTLAALKSRLALNAIVIRDGIWKNIAATGLVPGDSVKLSLGDIVCADVKLISGEILLEQSMITGESIPIEARPGIQTYAGALIRRGEATLAVFGLLMAPISILTVAQVLAIAFVSAFFVDMVKVPVFPYLKISQ